MGDIISWIIFGLVAGAIAKALRPGKDPSGWLITIILGIVGSIVGGFIGRAVFNTDGSASGSPWTWQHFLFAVGGAIIVLWIYGMVTRRGRIGA